MKQKILYFIIASLGGFLFGWLIFHHSGSEDIKPHYSSEVVSAAGWTCAMHPQIRMEEPGKCPICGMELIPVGQNSSIPADPGSIHLSKEAAQLANVQTTLVSKHKPVKEVRLYGKVQADERLLQSQVSHVAGRIDKLMITFTGETVKKGELLAQIYSPELITAQQELLESSIDKLAQPELYEAAKGKLSQWKLTDKQIESIEKSGIVRNSVDVLSNTSGIVIVKRVNTGDYVAQGAVLFDIADLSSVWVMFDAYESDLSFLRKGEKVSFTLQALPGMKLSGNIVFIDPVIDPVTRVAKVRVEADNQNGKLKPEMFATGIISTSLEEFKNGIIIPRSAVLWTGRRSIVYVKDSASSEPVFKLREVELGPDLGESYIILNGLSEGEEIVTNGTFSVDAAAQLDGKPSMMNVMQTSATVLEHAVFKVSGNCEMCKDRIEKAALSASGVKYALWDISSKKITLDFDSNLTSLSTIQKSIAKSGHDTELFKADDVTYKLLPDCCHYRD
jgi:membrane fusion protein, copper/silver efflux system